jgi:hypothetical protein
MTAAEKEWLKDRGGRACTGGTSVFTAGGQVFPHGANWDPLAQPQFANHENASLKGLNAALNKYHSEKAPQIDRPDPKELEQVVRRPFKGGLALSVTYTVLEWKTPPTLDHASSIKAVYEKVIPECPGVDHIWARKAEADALIDGQFPEKLQQRLALHVAYGMNEPSKVKKIDLTYRDGRVSGSFQFADGERAHALGFAEARDGKISRFDVIVKATGRGRHACGGVGPLHVLAEGKTAPVAIGFMLVDPESYMGRVPPHSARDLDRPKIKGSGD